MIEKLFLSVLNMSYVGAFVIVAVLTIRMILRGVPRKYIYLLWSVVLFRLSVPFSFESAFCLLRVNPKPIPLDIAHVPKPQINTGISVINSSVNQILPTTSVATSVKPMQTVVFIAALVWGTGVVLLLIYALFSHWQLKHKIGRATCIGTNVYTSNKLDTPFVMGLFRPIIYLPQALVGEARDYVIAHERAHIKRRDHLFRFLAYLTLCVHWFNPLVWLAFSMSGKDMEMACDEMVVTTYGDAVKPAYSQTLLNLTTKNYQLLRVPLAFGEGDTKGRVQHILNFSKPKLLVVATALIVIIVALVGLMSSPISGVSVPDITDTQYRVHRVVDHSLVYSFTYTAESAPYFYISSDFQLYTRLPQDSEWVYQGNLDPNVVSKKQLMAWIDLTGYPEQKDDSLLERIETIYRVSANDQAQNVFLIAQTDNGQDLIFQGYQSGLDVLIRWQFQVDREKVRDAQLSSFGLIKYRTPYVGNNSNVVKIVSQLRYPHFTSYYSTALHTDSAPYGMTVHLSDNVNADAFPDALDDLTRRQLEVNACTLFSLIENLDQISYAFDGAKTKLEPLVFNRKWAEDKIGVDLWQGSQSAASFNTLLTRINQRAALPNPALQLAINLAIGARQPANKPADGTVFFDSIILATDTNAEQNTVKVYLLSTQMTLQKTGQGMTLLDEFYTPSLLTFKKQASGEYVLINDWIPRVGEHYQSDIEKAKFPIAEYSAVFDDVRYPMFLAQRCFELAAETFDIDRDKAIDQLLKTIMSSPKHSSNAQDYLDAHPEAYRDLKYYGRATADYFERLRLSDASGLKRAILEIVYFEMPQ